MTEKIRAEVSKDLESLIPRYLERRRKDIEMFRAQIAAGDFEALRIGAHNLKGSGGGYGFPGLTLIGAAMETAAKAGDAEALQAALADYVDYLRRVEVTFI